MYQKFYGLRQRPFTLTPNPDFLYLSRVHEEAMGYLRFGIESEAGFIALTGEVGAGKTTVLQALLRTLDQRVTVARLVNTLLDPRELLESILIDLGAETVPASKPAMLRDLTIMLVNQRRQRRRVVLVIDEAQNLSYRASKSSVCSRTSRPRPRNSCISCWSASRICATAWRRPISIS